MLDMLEQLEMLEQLRATADYVLVDTPTVSTVADASAVAATADGVILVIDLERTRREELLYTKEQLVNARANIIGIVLNRSSAHQRRHERPATTPDPAALPAPPTFTI